MKITRNFLLLVLEYFRIKAARSRMAIRDADYGITVTGWLHRMDSAYSYHDHHEALQIEVVFTKACECINQGFHPAGFTNFKALCFTLCRSTTGR